MLHILSLSEKTKESVRMQQEANLVSMMQKYIPPGSELAVIIKRAGRRKRKSCSEDSRWCLCGRVSYF
jgi:hypothetical protein